jgi:Flp pilus assembly protein TadD
VRTVNTQPHTAADRALEDIREGRWSSALRNADAALAEGSTEAWLPRLRGVALTNLGRVEEAVAILETVVEADPSPVILHELAAARLAADDMLGARRAVNRAMAVDAAAPHTRRAVALLAMRNADWAGAETELRAVVLEDQFDIEALNNLAICLVQQGRSGEAMQYMSHARSRGQSTRHWQMLDHNYELLVAHRRPDDGGAIPEAAGGMGERAPQDDGPRPSMAAAMIRAGYEARKNPQGDRSLAMGRGFYRVMVALLVLTVLVTLLGAAVKEPPLAVFAAIIMAVCGVLWWRTRRGRHLTVLPTSVRLHTPPRRDRS